MSENKTVVHQQIGKITEPEPRTASVQHSPVPWKFGRTSREIYSANGKAVATIYLRYLPLEEDEAEARANAAFIVKSVNSHTELVDALKATNDYMGRCFTGEFDYDREAKRRAMMKLAETVGAALAKVETEGMD